MQRPASWKKIVLIVWACALAFGLTFQATQAMAAHATCNAQCKVACGGECGGALAVGCNCYWFCPDGSDGESICVS